MRRNERRLYYLGRSQKTGLANVANPVVSSKRIVKSKNRILFPATDHALNLIGQAE